MLVARLQEAFDLERPAEEAPVADAEEKMETEAIAAVAEEPEKTEEMATEEVPKTEEAPAAEKKTEAKVEEKKEEEKGTKRKADEEPPFEVKENEPEIPEALVCLDWYNSDLNLRITDNYMTGIPFSRLFSHHLSHKFNQVVLFLFFAQGWLGILLCWRQGNLWLQFWKSLV